MSSFEIGEVVDVTISGARVTNCYPEQRDGVTREVLCFTHEEDVPGHGAVYIGADAVAVVRVAPKEWPPRAGDLWVGRLPRENGGEIALLAVDIHDGVVTDVPEIVFAPDDQSNWGARVELDYAVRTFGPLVLARRPERGEPR